MQCPVHEFLGRSGKNTCSCRIVCPACFRLRCTPDLFSRTICYRLGSAIPQKYSDDRRKHRHYTPAVCKRLLNRYSGIIQGKIPPFPKEYSPCNRQGREGPGIVLKDSPVLTVKRRRNVYSGN